MDNSFLFVEGKEKLGTPKLCICLNLTYLNKAIMHEPYHFKTPEDITHLIANSCIMMVHDCKKGYWHQELDEASLFLTTFNTKLGRFRYTVVLFSITMAGDIFQWKLDQCFSHLKNVIAIAGGIMVVGKNQKSQSSSHSLTRDSKKMWCQIKLWQTTIQEDRSRLLYRNLHDQWMQTSPN